MTDYRLQSSVPVPDPKMPLVTMIVPTYGRAYKQPEILNEALYWLVNQDYPNIEVLVLNDAPGQVLYCEHSRVRCINWPERLPNLGDKMNLGVMLAAGSICMPAEDDDISLPWRVSQAVAALSQCPGYDYWSPKRWWYAPVGQPMKADSNGYAHNCSAYRRHSFLGRYSSVVLGHDRDAAVWAGQKLSNSPVTIRDTEISYVYRWGVSCLHLSGSSDPEHAWNSFHPGEPGRFLLIPVRRKDWVSECREAAMTP